MKASSPEKESELLKRVSVRLLQNAQGHHPVAVGLVFELVVEQDVVPHNLAR
jgi:hypothetical protein